MGIAFSHTVAILLLSARRALREERYREITDVDNCFICQETVRKIPEATTLSELRQAIRHSLSSVLSGTHSVVYLADSQDLYLDEDKQDAVPNRGIARDCIVSQEAKRCRSNTPDPILQVLKRQKSSQSDSLTYVTCIPVVDQFSGKVIAVLAVESNKEIYDLGALDLIKEQIVGCYRRLCKCQRENSYTPASPSLQNSVNVNGPTDQRDALLRLCGELYDQDATMLQFKIAKYLEEQTDAECAFLLLVVPETNDLICQVVGSRILQEEVSFPVAGSAFATVLETKKPISLQDIPLDKRKDIEDSLALPLKSLLCVPVCCKNQDSPLALACVANKENSDKFTGDDLQTVIQCFQYTATILRSTLAFQNERKLKLQTQAMLQVARNLFTHLGEFSTKNVSVLDNYPNLSQFLHMYKEQVPIPNRPRRSASPVGNSNGSAKVEQITEPLMTLAQQEILANKLSGVAQEAHSSKAKSDYVVHPVLKSQAHKSHPGYFDNSKLYGESDELNSSVEMLLSKTMHVEELEKQASSKVRFAENVAELSDDSVDVNGDDSDRDGTLKVEELEESVETELIDASAGEVDKLEKSQEVSVQEGQLSVKSYNTAGSEDNEEDRSVMYSAQDDMSQHDDVGEHTPDDEEYKYYDSVSDLSRITKTTSNTEIYDGMEDTGVADLSVHSHLSDKDFDTPAARMSNSAPSLCEVTEAKSQTESSSSSEYVESKPDLNYAFLSESLQLAADVTEEKTDSEVLRELSSHELIGLDHDPSGSKIDIVVEDIETHDRVTLSMHRMSHVSTHHRVSSVAIMPHPCGTIGLTTDKDLEMLQEYHPPSYNDILVVFDDLTKLLREIMQEARNLTQAERCSVFLIDKETDELVAKVFDGITTNDSEEQSEIRMPSTRGIAGHVATTGTLLNIKDAYSHPLFFRGIDDSTGFKTRNILCFPIKNEKGDVLGVAQLCNKKNGPYFTTFDEEVASAFAVYCCISISHSLMYQNVIASQIRNNLANELMMYHMKCLMYKKLQLSQHRNRLTNELMIYHMQVAPDDVGALVHTEIPPSKKWSVDFDKFPYPPREIPENDTPLACLTMFEDLGFISRWRIKKETLIRFTLMVRKGYRNPPYHNWMHAFAVAHFCFLCVKNLNLTEYLDDLELFALFVSCLGHDIDHRGTNNQYQVASKSVLAALYSSEGSVMERHHFAQTMCIVNTEGCNIFENLPSKDYTTVLDLVRDIILATDLAHHLKILGSLKEMAAEGYNKTNIRHRKNLLCLLMTASDLSDQTKPWNFTKHVAALIYREFFSQGDLEKALGQKPIEMMDRERARIPDLQIGFLDHIALPVYKVLSDIFPAADIVKNTVADNRRHWEKICALIKIRRGGSCEQMSYDQILALEEEEADAEIESYEQKQRQAEQNGR